MNRNLELMQSLSTLEFNGKMNGLEGLFQNIEDLIFYLEAQRQIKTAEQLLACNWELKTRMQYDREEQWLWTFVWMKDKVLRKLGDEDEVKTELEIQVFEVQEFRALRYAQSQPNHLLIGQTWDMNAPLGMGFQ